MSWHILLVDDEGQKFASSPLDTREQAISFARDLLASGGSLKVLRIESDQGAAVNLDELKSVIVTDSLETCLSDHPGENGAGPA